MAPVTAYIEAATYHKEDTIDDLDYASFIEDVTAHIEGATVHIAPAHHVWRLQHLKLRI